VSRADTTLELTVDHGHSAFEPGARLSGVAAWSLSGACSHLEVQLSWTALGWGGRDFKIVETITLPAPERRERRPFVISLPSSPYSFRGALISLSWALELIALPGDDRVRVDLTVAPGRRLIDLR
jgi:hypothetical protein